jgi:DNA-binding transcriptional regulator WhiA
MAKTSTHTKTGKVRLGPLSLTQLKDMLEKSSRPKDKAKIQNRIRKLEKSKVA